jgi:hypothetical protein
VRPEGCATQHPAELSRRKEGGPPVEGPPLVDQGMLRIISGDMGIMFELR